MKQLEYALIYCINCLVYKQTTGTGTDQKLYYLLQYNNNNNNNNNNSNNNILIIISFYCKLLNINPFQGLI